MTGRSWAGDRWGWVTNVSKKRLLDVIAYVARPDATGDDHAARLQTIRWLATRGRLGNDRGHAEEAARDVGRWDA
jgi:hypothetical protein